MSNEYRGLPKRLHSAAGRFCAGSLGPSSRAQTSRRRVLALTGDRYHNADYIRVALDRVLDGLNVTVDYTINY